MIGLPEVLAGAMLVSLWLYAVLGGADFGGGIWDLLASGPRWRAQRALIERAITPVWEANHVWLVLIVVILFSAFPPAFAQASIALHIPLTLVLVGIVIRGSAFVFLKFDPRGPRYQRRWTGLFGLSSVIAPFFLGVTLGTIATTNGVVQGASGGFAERYVLPWVQLLPLCVGALAPCLCALIAAVYLTLEAEEGALREDFRRRALGAGVASAACSMAVVGAAAGFEQVRFHEMTRQTLTWVGGCGIVGLAAAAAWLLARRRYRAARVAVVACVMLMIAAGALWQYPHLIRPHLTIRGAAAPTVTLKLLVAALALGALILFPSIFWLLRVFKSRAVFGAPDAVEPPSTRGAQ